MLLVVVLLALSAFTYCNLMGTHRRAALSNGRRIQVRLAVDSGVALAQQFAALDEETRDTQGGSYDNAQRFQGVVVLDDPDLSRRAAFSVVAPALNGQGEYDGIRYGLQNEAGRLNINLLSLADEYGEEAGRELLLAFPGMTEETADAILDWLDEDDEARPFGAESEYYLSLNPPYAPRNGPLETVEELLLVRGVTAEQLFGRDANRNYRVDPHEIDAPAAPSNAVADAMTGAANDLGWAAYLTIYTVERSNQESEKPRVYLNQPDMQKLYDELLDVFGNNKEWAMFVVAYRQNGPHEGASTLDSATSRDLDLDQPGRFPIAHVLDLVDQNVEVFLLGDDEPIVLASPFQEDQAQEYLLPELTTKLAVHDASFFPGRVNVMEATATVLMAIPGMTESIMDEILVRRSLLETGEAEPPLDENWLYTEGIVTLEEMRAIAPFITIGGEIYRAQVVGYFCDGTASSRVEIVLDAGHVPPRPLLWRDLTHLGRGFSLQMLCGQR